MYAFEWSGESRAIVRSASSNLVLGETRNDMRDGLRGELVARIHPADQPMFQRALRGVAPDKPAYCVEYRYIRPDGETIWLQTSGVGEFGPSGQQLRVTGFTRDITARKQAEIRQSLLVRELHHRVKNNLATVLALANLSARNATSVEDYKTKLRARIHSMARSHALLNEAPFRTAYLRNVLQDELEPYAQGSIDRIRIEGPDVDLPAEAALALAMAVHELATNAGKYGALSTEKGRVDVRWERLEAQGRSRLRLHWRESGGPPVTPPARKGFGSRLLESVIGDQLKGRVQIDYRPEGLVVEIEASLDRIPVEAPIAAAG
jgi:two-component sensor histidine kinase